MVIAANAGGAWTPIGDVTTTMLWIHGHISTFSTIKVLLHKLSIQKNSLRSLNMQMMEILLSSL